MTTMERWLTKLLAIVIIFIVVLFFTLLPIKVHGIFESWGHRGKQFISYFMCFGGGVFLSIYMLHMAPDAQELVMNEIIKPNDINYPLAELLVAVGFFLMVFVETCVLNLNSSKTMVYTTTKMDDSERNIGEKLSQDRLEQLDTTYSHLSLEYNLKHGDIQKERYKTENDTQEPPMDFDDSDHNHHHHIDLSGSRSLILLCALSLHHIFEGISVGLKNNNADVWSLTFAILMHEVVIAFSLGLQLVKAYKSIKRVFIAAILCTSMVPLGIAIGIALSETNNEEVIGIRMANGILQSIATGVFVYVTFFEILAGELSQQRPTMTKLLSMLLGFVTMALLALIPEETNGGLHDLNETITIDGQ